MGCESPLKAQVIMAGMVLAWLVSPESLAVFGQLTGSYGVIIIAPLAIAMVFAALCATLLHDRRVNQDGGKSEFAILSAVYGRLPAAALALSGRIPVFFFASTAMLVSAGFAFNEIFIYWFPNFLFASLLLVVISILHLFEEKVAVWGQVVFAGVAVAGLVILMALGMGGDSERHFAIQLPRPEWSFTLLGTLFILFLGFELSPPVRHGGVSVFVVSGLLAFLLLTGWALLALTVVSPARLVASSLPHILTARGAGGDAGHAVIGVVIISGAMGGVNGFFLVVRRTLTGLTESRFFPAFIGKRWFTAIVAALAIEAMMLSGVAGDDMIDTQLRAALLLWLAYVGFRLFAAGMVLQRPLVQGRAFGSLAAGGVFLFAAFMVLSDTHFQYMWKVQAATVFVFYLFSMAVSKTYERFSLQR